MPERAETRYLADNDAVLRYDTVPGGVYTRYLEVRRPTPDVLAVLRPIVAGDGVQRVILDIRQNPGGDNHNIPAPIQLLAHFRFHHPEGDVVVITDRVTFSAAANLATDLEALFDPIYVGEPMGGGLTSETTSPRSASTSCPHRCRSASAPATGNAARPTILG